MIARLGNWDRFACFVGGNVLVLALLYATVFCSGRDFLQDQRARIDQLSAELRQSRLMLERARSIPASDPEETSGAARRFVKGDNPSLMSAALLTRLREIASEQNLVLTSVTALPGRAWLGRQLVGAKIEFSGPVPQAAQLLSEIEGGRLFLFVRTARLSAPDGNRADEEPMEVSAEIYGVTGWRGS